MALGSLALTGFLSVFLHLRGASWLTLWGAILAIFFFAALASEHHQVLAANRARRLVAEELKGADRAHLGWLRYGRWAPLLRTCYDVEQESCALRRRFALRMDGVIRHNLPKELVKQQVQADPYALSKAESELNRARRFMKVYLKEAQNFARDAQRRVLPHLSTIPQGTKLARAIRDWDQLTVSRGPVDLERDAESLIAREEEVVDGIRHAWGQVSIDAEGYPTAHVGPVSIPNDDSLRELEQRAGSFLRTAPCSE